VTKFIPGLRLSELYFYQCVEPILRSQFPGLKYSAGLLGSGSEVLGSDYPQSRDHNWGPRLIIFLRENGFKNTRRKLDRKLRKKLPHNFLGYSTSFGKPDMRGVRLAKRNASGEVDHFITFTTIRSFIKEYLGIDAYQKEEATKWLFLPQQKFLTLVRGGIFHDDLRLNLVIKKFQYYPKDVWLYILVSQWERISQDEPFVARAAVMGDELGSKLLAMRIIRRLMELCFLIEKKYAPYSK
jgi:hypothetical protein